MFLKSEDVDSHKKGLTKKQRKKFIAIANSVFAVCKDEAKAIRVASANFEVPFNPVAGAELEERLRKMAADNQNPENQKNVGEIPEMEIFRTGIHNGEPFEEKDLQQIVDNFHALKNEVRPKLKITHREHQNTLAGLASYGDVVDVFIRQVADGSKRLFAKIANVPNQVMDWIRDRRFPERSIELYGKVKLGTVNDEKIYRSVLKNIALLGAEMPAVSGMEPIKLSETLEKQEVICFGEVCFPCEEKAREYQLRLVSACAIADMLAAKFKN